MMTGHDSRPPLSQVKAKYKFFFECRRSIVLIFCTNGQAGTGTSGSVASVSPWDPSTPDEGS